MSPIYELVVTNGSFAKLKGASGLVKIIAPLPSTDVAEEPLTLSATITACMLEPQGKLNGAVVKVALGIVHVKSSITVRSPPLQSVSSSLNVRPSTYLNLI